MDNVQIITPQGIWYAVYAMENNLVDLTRVLAWRADGGAISAVIPGGPCGAGCEEGDTTNFVGFFPSEELDDARAAVKAWRTRHPEVFGEENEQTGNRV